MIDIGGTNVKILCTGQTEPRKFRSGPETTPARMVAGVKDHSGGWVYDVVAIGYPGRVVRGKVISEPCNLASGWVGFDFEAAFGHPTRVINDAAMQALGSYKGGTLLFLGFGTGLGSALVVESNVVPLELGHLSYKNSTFEDYVGKRGRKRLGKKKWERHVAFIISRLIEAVHPDDVVLGGGEAEKLRAVPAGCRRGSNANAFVGGFRLWEAADR
ncbi:MAG TPA: ROK family protein [Blastocatellia bacterium]|nr:ROK family protein [Blastocatellia bacterium]